jgi:hypothetical protein
MLIVLRARPVAAPAPTHPLERSDEHVPRTGHPAPAGRPVEVRTACDVRGPPSGDIRVLLIGKLAA